MHRENLYQRQNDALAALQVAAKYEGEDGCLYPTVCLLFKPNKETECRDYSLLDTLFANMAIKNTN